MTWEAIDHGSDAYLWDMGREWARLVLEAASIADFEEFEALGVYFSAVIQELARRGKTYRRARERARAH